MSTALKKAAWVDRVFAQLSELDPKATIEQLKEVAEDSFAATDSGTPEAWAERYFRLKIDADASDRQWRLAFWERVFELEPRLSLMDAWDLWETAVADPIQSERPASQAAEHLMGVSLPPMTDGRSPAPAQARENLVLSVAGASQHQIERALAAVDALFAFAKVSPTFAVSAAHKLERWDAEGFPPEKLPSNAEFDAAQVWSAVPECVLDAVFGSERPPNALSLVEVFVPPTDRTLH
ncbi:hypothetical protein [Rhizobacter sp. Root16D2]|uniref:hypothetical protein n=1 Tax=Rhizobacter sp. Root16D2 TaxID=1736479 RepID=UPI0006F21A39|nr:hypothetical protein [Rhizobacter sp. Root16D2]KRB14679.1 hypothetical protein ASE08_09645 [Rhizobacter sp. Root16D2]